MKKLSLILIFIISTIYVNAQIINFPDANFKTKLLQANVNNFIAKDLNNNYCKIDINSNNEIEISEAINIKNLKINAVNIQNLEGISNFSNLENLDCSYNQITNLNAINLTNLKYLTCSYNQITNLNVNNLTNLISINCNNNFLTTIDVSNLAQINKLYVHNNQLSAINTTALMNLKELGCENNQITELNLTSNTLLEKLYCRSNLITNLNTSTLVNLNHLDCTFNLISNLELTSNIFLEFLYCSNNQLTNLNTSTLTNLVMLTCSNNIISTINLENNTNIIEFNCNNNSLISLFVKNGKNESGGDYYDIPPPFHFQNNPNLQYICADESQISDIQNRIQEYGYTNCHVNTYCSFVPGGEFYTIQGQQKFDNENDVCDTNDNFISNFKYSITDGTTIGSVISNNTGSYSIPVQAGSYTVTPILENPSYFSVSQSNVMVDFPTQTSPFTQDFCIIPNGIKLDVEISIIPTNPARPGFDATYKIIYKNKGNQIENGTINLQFDDAVLDVVSINPVFTTQTLNNLNFNYSNLNPFETREINIVLNVNSPMETPAIIGGDILNYTATITQSGTDEIISDNTFVLNQTVVNSYDPNDKTCLQGNYVGPDKIGQYVHYIIRFENTGTFPAENIVVKDMIDTTKFDVSSLIPLHASHNYVTKIADNKVEFIFENINLPFDDANNDGYIAFKIKTLPSLVLGNTFSNSANIYFDYNFPIVTNTATTTITALSNPSFEFTNYFSLYPNPTTNELNINLKSAIEINSIQIYNTIGQLVTIQTGNTLKMDVSNLKTGNYFIKINTNEGCSTSQFIKE